MDNGIASIKSRSEPDQKSTANCGGMKLHEGGNNVTAKQTYKN